MRQSVLIATSISEILGTSATELRCSDGVVDVRSDRDVIVWSRAGHASNPTRVQGPLSVRAVWHGAESFVVGRRTLCVDDDTYLVINDGHAYSTLAHRRDAPESLTVFFSNETRRECERVSERDFFSEHLRPHDDVATPDLRDLLDAVRCGVVDNAWYAQRVRRLYASLVLADEELHRRAVVFAPASLLTRTELLRQRQPAPLGGEIDDRDRLRELELHECGDAGRHCIGCTLVQIPPGAAISRAARRFPCSVRAPKTN